MIMTGEKIDLEFRRSKNDISKDVYDSVCSFNNRNRTHIILGLHDNKEILGVESEAIDKFEPFPKNPPISKVFREIGLADELGSGMRNTNLYTKLYSVGTPTFDEGDIFKIMISLKNLHTRKVGPDLAKI